ncbi:motility associated factor glycosyltransferase family protein [Nautilia sp.]
MQELFKKNINFLYKNLPHLYEKIKTAPKEHYIKNDNIYAKNGKKIYKTSITEDSKKLSFYPTHNPLWEKKFFYITPSLWEDKFFITGKAINSLIKKASSFNNYTEGFYFDKNFLPTTAVFGLLAGKHLQILAENFEFQSLFVYEPNPEFFAISLYFVDYEKIYEKLNGRFFLWIGGKIDYHAIEKFYYERKITSSFLTLTLKTYNHPLINDALSKFEEIRVSKLRGWGTYEDEIKGIKNYLDIYDKYPVLSQTKDLNVPFCIAANGKSLEQNIPFIKKNIDSMILISVGTALKPLLKAGIESDFHIEQERIDLLAETLKDTLPEYNGIFVGSNVVDKRVFDLAKTSFMYNREGFSFSENHILSGSSPLVGNAGVAFAANFTKEIYLCGMDLGFRLNMKKHASGSFYDSRNDTEQNGIKIKGNFSNDIYTDSLYLSSKQNIENLIRIKGLNVYNLSDGAYIKNTVPLKYKTLPRIDKKNVIKEIKSCFNAYNKKPSLPDLHHLIKPVKNVLQKPVKNYKELTGLIDFIDNAFDRFLKTNPKEYTLLRGSLSHILNNLYILSHKTDIKNAAVLKKTAAKHLNAFQKHIEKINT